MLADELRRREGVDWRIALVRAGFAQGAEPIRIGWLAALTGASSAPAVGFNRGVVPRTAGGT